MSSSPFTPAVVEPDLGRGAQARLALIRVAAEVFGESGLEAATTRDIAQRAGQNIAAIAYYFGSKEGLYVAVAQHIVEVVIARIGPLLNEVESFLDQDRKEPARCVEYLKRLLAISIVNNREMVPVTGIIVREQTHPTKAFSILYDGCLEPMHRLGSELIRAYLGEEADVEECIIRFHAMLGQALAFRFARGTIMRRAGWEEIGAVEEAKIGVVVTEHVDLIVRGMLSSQRRRSRRTRRVRR
jgi:AcrR family transcriptional regulator